jgi:hypothetical protein
MNRMSITADDDAAKLKLNLDAHLNKNGWQWCLVSTLTPGVVRIQMGAADQGDEFDEPWRKCFEGATPEEAIAMAEEFITRVSAQEYSERAMEKWSDGPSGGDEDGDPHE